MCGIAGIIRFDGDEVGLDVRQEFAVAVRTGAHATRSALPVQAVQFRRAARLLRRMTSPPSRPVDSSKSHAPEAPSHQSGLMADS